MLLLDKVMLGETPGWAMDGGVLITGIDVSGPQNTVIAAGAGTTNGVTVDLGTTRPNQRTMVLAQWVPQAAGGVANSGSSLGVQFSLDNTLWWEAPNSTMGSSSSSVTGLLASANTVISRGQVLTRYFRFTWTGALGNAAGRVLVWWVRGTS